MSDDQSSEQLDDWNDREPPPEPFTRNLILGIAIYGVLLFGLLWSLRRLFHG